jgi:ubiquinol-cytochrome c reductase cytochrome c1 subunit
MVRIIAFFIGVGFAFVLLISLITGISGSIASPAEPTAEEEFHKEPKHLALASDGPFGKFDRQQLQRGFQVYKEVCAACHSMNLVAFRDLHALGYSEAEVKAIANQWMIEVPSVNPDTGEAATRKAIPADRFPSPYPNETAARAANNNALPPDLSLIAKAREGGPAYTYSLLTGYADPNSYRNEAGEALPAANRPGTGLHFNPYFANLNIAMPPPLVSAGQVTYAEGNPQPTGEFETLVPDSAAREHTTFNRGGHGGRLWTAARLRWTGNGLVPVVEEEQESLDADGRYVHVVRHRRGDRMEVVRADTLEGDAELHAGPSWMEP